MTTVDRYRLEAFDALLSLPDPSDLQGRGHRLTCEGDPNRHTVIERIIRAFLAHRRTSDHAVNCEPAKKAPGRPVARFRARRRA